MDLNIVISSLNLIIITIFAFAVFAKDFKNKTNRSFFLLGLAIAFWILSNLLADLSKENHIALIWTRLAIIGPGLMPLLLFNLVEDLFEYVKFRKLIFRLFFISTLIICLLSFTPFNIKEVYLSDFGTGFSPGPLYYFLFTYFLLGFGYTFYILIRIYRNSRDPVRSQAKFILLGSALSIFVGLILNILLPILGFSIASVFGPPGALFFIFFTALAVLRYHLFNLKVIASELFTSIIAITLLVRGFSAFPNNLTDVFINGILFIFVGIFGILLVRSVIKEVEQKEEIAKMAEDVRRAYVLEKKAKEEVNKAYALEKKVNEDLEQLDKVKDQFLAQTQHDLRTPLTSIMGYTDLLLRGTFGKQTKKTTEVVVKLQGLTDGMIKKANNFLDLAQFQLGKSAVLLKPGVNIFTILSEIKNELDFKAENKGIKVILEKPEKEILIKADREKLKAAIFNIVDNSVKYTQTGSVTITLESTDKVKVSIIDTGIGIPQEKVKTIFESMFDRTEQAKKIASGAGVGLYLSTQIIKDHGGKVWAESEGEGKGSRFFIEFPLDDGLPVPVAPLPIDAKSGN